MALQVNDEITIESILERFKSAVVDNILKDAYHSGNPPLCRGYQCVPSSMMDHIDNVNKVPTIGYKKNIIGAEFLLNGLVDLTRNLTRVGSFVTSIYMKHTDSGTDVNGNTKPSREWKTLVESKEGKVIFNQSYIRKNFSNPDSIEDTTYNSIIRASKLNQLLANLYSHWANTNREKYTNVVELCHEVCHDVCHNNCHDHCHSTCHGWSAYKITRCHAGCPIDPSGDFVPIQYNIGKGSVFISYNSLRELYVKALSFNPHSSSYMDPIMITFMNNDGIHETCTFNYIGDPSAPPSSVLPNVLRYRGTVFGGNINISISCSANPIIYINDIYINIDLS